jgi:hypothetical protein
MKQGTMPKLRTPRKMDRHGKAEPLKEHDARALSAGGIPRGYVPARVLSKTTGDQQLSTQK